MITPNTRAGDDSSSRNALPSASWRGEPKWGNEILVADDDDAVRKSLVRLLTCHGYPTITAANGIEALQLAMQRKPSILLMDVEMPTMNGLDAARAIKSQATLNGVQIIALSASLIPRHTSDALFTQSLQKPCPGTDVIAAIEAAIFQHCSRKAPF